MKQLIVLALIGLVIWKGYEKYQANHSLQAVATPSSQEPNIYPDSFSADTSRFKCDGRTYCSQMTSCEEATFFLRNCPGTKMDGDHDGIPCEDQWCRS